MRIILLLFVALIGIYVGQNYLAAAATPPGLVNLPCVPTEFRAPAIGKLGERTIRLPCPENAGASTPVSSSDGLVIHLLCALFALFAIFLLLKHGNQQVTALFAVAVLATLFGRYIEPLQLPDFLSVAPLIRMV